MSIRTMFQSACSIWQGVSDWDQSAEGVLKAFKDNDPDAYHKLQHLQKTLAFVISDEGRDADPSKLWETTLSTLSQINNLAGGAYDDVISALRPAGHIYSLHRH